MARIGIEPITDRPTGGATRSPAAARPASSSWKDLGASTLDSILFSYSQIFFTRDRAVGALLLAATMVVPRNGLLGLAAVLLSLVVVRAARFSPDLMHRGLYGYNPLLCGLAVGAFVQPLPTALMILPIVIVAVVFLQTALESAIGYMFNLPVLSLPFVLVTFLLLAILPFLRDAQPAAFLAALEAAPPEWLPEVAGQYLRTLGAIFFAPEVLAGAIVATALFLYSRIGFLLSLLGFGIAWLLLQYVFVFETSLPALVVSYNAALIAIALGGVWFVPQRSSFLFAAVAVLLTTLISVASFLFLGPWRFPVLILPFNLAMILTLYAMRQRMRDGAPKAVDFLAGSPEVNLNYYRTRVARFGSLGLARLALPFQGRWTVTQGVDGRHTHQGLWRHGLDFEVLGEDGRNCTGDGREAADFHCWRLPVLAPADGTVIKIVDHVVDNPIGERNPNDSWGNLVLVQHGVGLYSMVCHLSAGSVDVQEGQFVRRGTRLGTCGNSGRSFVPHVHFQIQASPRVDAPTREVEFYDVVADGPDTGVLYRYRLPEEGETVRNIDVADDVADLFAMRIGSRFTFRVTGPDGRARDEQTAVRIDLYNNLYLESDRGDRLFFENQNRQFLVYDYQGRKAGVLYLLYAAAARVPFERAGAVEWDDVLDNRHFRPRWMAWLADLADPFLSLHGLGMSYRAHRANPGLEIRGEGRHGRSAVSTTALFRPGVGPAAVTLKVGKRAWAATLLEVGNEP